MSNRTPSTAEFKRQALELAARPALSPRRAAQDLGINPSVLYEWRRQEREKGAQAFPGQGRQFLTPEQQELQQLRQEVEILRQEREILKKAAAFFAKESR